MFGTMSSLSTMRKNPRWYDNPELLLAAKEEYGSLTAAAEAIGGVSSSALQKAWKRHGLPKLFAGRAPQGPTNQEALDRLYERVYGN